MSSVRPSSPSSGVLSHSDPQLTMARIQGHGEMADLVRTFDWASTPLGPIESWPDTLLTTVNLVLASRHPMFLWWGPELIQIYNDGYRPSIRLDKHPSALGQRGIECWPEIWPIIGPQIEAVMDEGKSSWNNNQLVPINRDGKLEEVYWTYGYSPVRDEQGLIQGTLVVCTETTQQVLSYRRLRSMLEVAEDSSQQLKSSPLDPLRELASKLVSNLASNSADIPFAALFLFDNVKVIPAGYIGLPESLAVPGRWPVQAALQVRTPSLLQELPKGCGDLVLAPWPEPITRAYLLPLRIPGSSISTVFVFGISPRLPFDDNYKTFLHLIGTRITGSLQSEVHRLENAQAVRQFRSLAEADPFGMAIGRLDGNLTYANPAFRKCLGYSADELLSGNVRWSDLSAPEYAEADANAVQQLRKFGRCDVYEKVYIAKDGRRVPILIGASLIDTPGPESEIAAFITDLTLLKTAQQDLRKAKDDLEKKVAERTAELKSEVQDRKRAETALRELTGRLLRAQDEERRHIGRELHDHAGQTLAALAMNLAALQNVLGDSNPAAYKLAAQSQQLSDDLSREIRTLSYLLHPPLLDEVGLISAVRWYVEGFVARSHIQIHMDLPNELGRLPRQVELVVFRVIQEALTNIHRHSGSTTAEIRLRCSEDSLQFEIADNGTGISPEKLETVSTAKAGVGLRGMEERIRQFEGTLRLISNNQGTTVAVHLPLKPPQGKTFSEEVSS